MATGARHNTSPLMALLSVSILLALSGCDFEKIADPVTAVAFKSSHDFPIVLSNSNGREKTVFYDLETVFVDVYDLLPTRQYCIEVAREGELDGFRHMIVLSDTSGRIRSFPAWYDLGIDSTMTQQNISGNYEIRFQGHNRKPVIKLVKPFTVVSGFNPHQATVIPTNGLGQYNGGSVPFGEGLYAAGAGFPAATEIRLYLVEDRTNYAEGDTLIDLSGGFETVLVDANGNLANTLIAQNVAASPGTGFDLIGDVPPYGRLNPGDALREARLTGVLVQEPSTSADIIMQLAADSTGAIKDFFIHDPLLEDVLTVEAKPSRQPLMPSDNAAIYIVNHQDVWQAGDLLVNITEVGSQEMPNLESLRYFTGSKLRFPKNIFKKSASHPALPGRYDVVIDVGRNGIYDPGTDLLDGGPQAGFTVAGEVDSIRTFIGTKKDFLPPGGQTPIYAKVLRDDDSPVSGIRVHFDLSEEYRSGTLSSDAGITDETGVAQTMFFADNSQGSLTIVDVRFEIGEHVFEHEVSIWIKCRLHDQGTIRTGF